MAAAVNMELDPIFLKALGFLRSKSKDSAEKLKALLDESLARGADSSYRPSQKVLVLDNTSHFYMPLQPRLFLRHFHSWRFRRELETGKIKSNYEMFKFSISLFFFFFQNSALS